LEVESKKKNRWDVSQRLQLFRMQDKDTL
jgi:hypothetical protein